MSSKSHLPFSVDLGLLILRLATGFIFFALGTQKLFGWFEGLGLDGTAKEMESIHQIPGPMASAVIVGVLQLLGGCCVLSGVGARLMAFPLMLLMLIVGLIGFSDAFWSQKGGIGYPALLATCALVIGIAGPGRFALRLKKGKNKTKG